MKTMSLLFAACLALTTINGMAGEKKPAVKKKAQTLCPAMNSEINKKLFVDVKGKRIYVCCPPCKKKIKADPDKYIKILEGKGVKIEDAPKPEEKTEKK